MERYSNFLKLTSTGNPKAIVTDKDAVPPDYISDSKDDGIQFKKGFIRYKCIGFFLKYLSYKRTKPPPATTANTLVSHALHNLTTAPSVTLTLTTTGLN